MLRRGFGWRLSASVATAAAAIACGAAASTAVMPSGRGWEMVSPANKNGGDVVPVSTRTRAAADGDAVNFTSLIGFADVHGATIGTEYISHRTGTAGTPGWAAYGITPTQDPLMIIGAIAGSDPAYDGDMSADLSAGVFRAYRPLTDAPNVAGLLNLYVRRDLRDPGAGFYELISDPGFSVATPIAPVRPFIAGASSDFSHVIFESRLNLSPDASGNRAKLYEWANGTLRLAGILPDGTAASSSQAGQGAAARRPTPHMISADGSRVFFQAPIGSGNVYMRVNGTTTVQLNASEKSTPEASQDAQLWTASVDGSRIFFSTAEGLVDGDDDGAEDYYMYDVNAPTGHHLTLISSDNEPSVADSGLGVVGSSDDGHYLYFMMFGQLVAGESPLVSGLYAWHDGSIRYIGAFADDFNTGFNTLNDTWLVIGTTMAARVAADGTHVMFMATNDAGFRGRGGFAGFDHGTACDGGGCRELYVYNAVDGRLQCASCAPSGALPTGRAEVNTRVDAYASATTSTPYLNHALSSDGRWAFFNTPDALVPGDVNGRIDPYAYDTETGRVTLLSSGRATDSSYFLEASASGRDAFFVTRERLVGWDLDGSYDLYDARVGGGMPEPVSPPPACAGDACQASSVGSAAPETPASSSFSGSGDLHQKLSRHTKPKRCKHGMRRFVRRGRVRCVRRKSQKGRRTMRSQVNRGGER